MGLHRPLRGWPVRFRGGRRGRDTLAARGKEIFTTEDAYQELGEGRSTRDLLERLAEKGWLKRIEKGKYLIVPLEAGPDRTWSEDPHVIAGYLVTPSMVAYWSALNYWNLTEQVPRITYVQTTARKESRRPTVLGMKFRIVRVKPEKFLTAGISELDPSSPRESHRIVTRWRVKVNLPEDGLLSSTQ